VRSSFVSGYQQTIIQLTSVYSPDLTAYQERVILLPITWKADVKVVMETWSRKQILALETRGEKPESQPLCHLSNGIYLFGERKRKYPHSITDMDTVCRSSSQFETHLHLRPVSFTGNHNQGGGGCVFIAFEKRL